MDPISITLIVVSAVSGFTAVVSFIGSKIHHKHKENKKIITKITEGDIIKKYDHSHKTKSKLKDKNKGDKEDDANHLKLEKISTKSKTEESLEGKLSKTDSTESSISSSCDSSGIITEVKFKQIVVEENLSLNKEGSIITFGGNIEFKPNSNGLKALATNGLELLGKDLIDHHVS
jgi:hypothetical protein